MKINAELQKLNLINIIISLQDYEVLSEIESFINVKTLNKSKLVQETITGDTLTVEEFQEHIYLIRNDVKNGKFINHSEILKEIENE